MDNPSQGSYNRNNGRGQQQPHRPFHPYKNRRNNFQPNNRNIRFNGPGDGANKMNPTSFVPQGFSSPIVRQGGGEYFHNHRNNRNGGNGNYRNDGLRNRKNFTPFKKQSAEEYDVRRYFHVSMIQDPWAECTKRTEFVFANEPTDDDDGEPNELDATTSPDTARATDENDDD